MPRKIFLLKRELVDCPTQLTLMTWICQLCSMTNTSEKYERTQQGNLLSIIIIHNSNFFRRSWCWGGPLEGTKPYKTTCFHAFSNFNFFDFFFPWCNNCLDHIAQQRTQHSHKSFPSSRNNCHSCLSNESFVSSTGALVVIIVHLSTPSSHPYLPNILLRTWSAASISVLTFPNKTYRHPCYCLSSVNQFE